MNEIALRLAERLFDRPIIQNQYRSAFVEAMLEPVLAGSQWCYAGDGWSGWDFQRTDGARLEVKQSAAIQTWSEKRNIITKGAFDIASRTGYFSEGGSKWSATPGRPADVYVFAWNETDNHSRPENWMFFVVLTERLPSQKTISLTKVKLLAATSGQSEALGISELASRVTELLKRNPSLRMGSAAIGP
jgi:hypothetical protein